MRIRLKRAYGFLAAGDCMDVDAPVADLLLGRDIAEVVLDSDSDAHVREAQPSRDARPRARKKKPR